MPQAAQEQSRLCLSCPPACSLLPLSFHLLPAPASSPRSGGIQLAWPQFGSGPLQRDGFLRNLHWSVAETAWRQPEGEQQASEQLRPSPGGGFAVEGPQDCPGLETAVAEGHDMRPMISLYADTGAGGGMA